MPHIHLGLSWAPIVGVSCGLGGLIICYCIAVSSEHVSPILPYISSTGNRLPESCLFTILFNVAAAFGYLTTFIRYKLLAAQFEGRNPHLIRINRAAFVFGILSPCGLSIVGSFQSVSGEWIAIVHWIGAGMTSGFGVAFMWLQSVLTTRRMSYKGGNGVTFKPLNRPWVVVLRFSLSIAATVCFIFFASFLVVANNKFTGEDDNFWREGQTGWPEHVTSAVSQWILFTLVMSFYLSFVIEFRRIRMVSPLIQFRVSPGSREDAEDGVAMAKDDMATKNNNDTDTTTVTVDS